MQEAPNRESLAGRDIARILWRGRLPLLIVTLAITAVVTALAFSLTPEYEATVVLMPVADTDAGDRLGSLGSAISQFGGLASLAGLSPANGSLKVEALATLQSEALTDKYIQQNNLLPILYRRKWDAARLRWKSSDPSDIPTLWKANRYFRDHIRSVIENARTGVVSMTVTWRDPREAAKWANDLVAITNDYLRTKAIEEGERNIAFLEEQTKRNTVVSIQQAISSLTETELKKVMLAQSREQYALKVLDPATVPEKQAFPLPMIWIPTAFCCGLFVGILFVLLRVTGNDRPAK
jgi:uncharacterized protein involved in exopolysaccharide biosynthesis